MQYNNPGWKNNQSPALNADNLNALANAVSQDGQEIATLQTQLASPFNYKGVKASTSDLPSSGNTINDTYYVTAENCLYSWDGAAWGQSSYDATGYAQDLSKLNNSLYYSNSVDLLAKFANYSAASSGDVTFTWSADHKVCTAYGTASSASFQRLYYSTSALPSGVIPGEKYLLRLSTTSNDFYVGIYFYDSGGSQISGGGYWGNYTVTIPSNAVGMLFRVFVPAGKTVNNTLTLDGFLTTYSNQELKSLIDGVDADVQSLQSMGLLDVVNSAYLTDGTDLNTMVGENKVYLLNSPGTYLHLPDGFSGAGVLFTYYVRNATVQFVYRYGGGVIYSRWYNHNTSSFNSWRELSPTKVLNVIHDSYLPTSTDLNDVHDVNEVWMLSAPNSYGHLPWSSSYSGMLFVFYVNNMTVQIGLRPYGGQAYTRRLFNGSWSAWAQLSGGGGTSITVQQIYNQYYSTNTINCSPTITTSTNNYLAATGDTTDVTASIETMLTTTGTCHLGPGDFWVSGIDMPAQSAIIGSGPATRIYLTGGNSDAGYAIKLNNRCTVSNLAIYGNTEDHTSEPGGSSVNPYDPDLAMVQRHGILLQGTYSTDYKTPRRMEVSDVYIANFTGGGVTCYDTGPNVAQGLNLVNAHIWYCYTGINISFYSEFNSFTNAIISKCHYAVIDNGGNNNFTNCRMVGNICNLLMDDSTGTMTNNSHSSFTGCIFGHADGNNGSNITLNGLDYGQLFVACDIFYGSVDIDNCTGMSFSGCEFGTGIDINVTNGASKLTLFSSCIFRGQPTVTLDAASDKVLFNGCYTTAGTAVTGS